MKKYNPHSASAVNAHVTSGLFKLAKQQEKRKPAMAKMNRGSAMQRLRDARGRAFIKKHGSKSAAGIAMKKQLRRAGL